MNGAITTTPTSVSNVHWIYNTLAAEKYFGTPFGVGRNTLTAPMLQRIDPSIYKNFSMTERLKLQIRGEVQPRIIRLGGKIIF